MTTPIVYASCEERREAELRRWAQRQQAAREEEAFSDDELDDLLEETAMPDEEIPRSTSAEIAQAAVECAKQSSRRELSPQAFPVSDVSSLALADAPLERMVALAEELAIHKDYLRVREEYCQLSIQLNIEGRLAPAFRPTLVHGKKWGDGIFMVIFRDQLVIDCHWLQSTMQQPRSISDKDAEWRPLFHKTKPFPFDLAWKFANKNWGKTHRAVGMFRLTPLQQCQMKALRSKEQEEKIGSFEKPIGNGKGAKSTPAPIALFELRLNEWCERDRRMIKHRDTYIAVWRARSYLGKHASVSQVGQLVAFMLGEKPKDDKSIRAKEENIRRHILGADWGRD